MKPFTHLEFETYYANVHQIDFLKRQYDEYNFGDGFEETESDYNNLLYLRQYYETYLLMKAYMNAIHAGEDFKDV